MGSSTSWSAISRRRRRPAIICMHDVLDRDWLRDFLQELSRRAEVVSLREVVDGYASTSDSHPRVAVTLDDGYKSIRTVVEPACSELGMPFTTFVCGEVLTGGPALWYDRVELLLRKLGPQRAAGYWGLRGSSDRQLISALKEAPTRMLLQGLSNAEADASIDSAPLRSRFMSAEDLAVLARNPLVTIGSHTYSHPILSKLDVAERRLEVQRGVDVLRDVCPSPIEFFAYPNGKPEDFDDEVIAALRSAGLRAAVTTVQRPLLPSDDLMRLPRLGVSEGDSIGKLEAKWSFPWLSVGDLREKAWRRMYRGSWREGRGQPA